MKILALEFSSPQRSVAVVEAASDRPAAPGMAGPCLSEVIETGTRTVRTETVGRAPKARNPGALATRAFAMIEEALRTARLEREQIECLVIGLGPGSYTGIRSAIALAQGWQLARDVKLLGLSSADGLAAQAHNEGLTGSIQVVIDAQRNEFYLAGYELAADGWKPTEPLRLATLAEVQAREQAGGILLGPEVTHWFPHGRLAFPRAATLGQLAAGRTDFLPGEKIEPIYLRETKFVKAPPPRIV